MSLKIEEITSFTKLRALSDEWKEVLSKSGEDRVFLGLGWLTSWWETFGSDHELLVLHVKEDGRSIGFAPLMGSMRGRLFTWRKLGFIGTGSSDRCGIIAKWAREDVHRAVWEHILSEDDWDVIELRDMLEGGPTSNGVHAMLPMEEQVTSPSPHIVLNGEHQSYLRGLRPKMRQSLRCYSKRVLSEGGRFRTLRTPDETKCCIDTLKRFMDSRWDVDNVLKIPRMTDFIKIAVDSLMADGLVVFRTLEIKGETAAISLGFEDEGRYLHYLCGFDERFSWFSPGSVLLSNIIEDCCARGFHEVDLLRGEEGYKYRFNAVDRNLVQFRAVRPGIVRGVEYGVRETQLS